MAVLVVGVFVRVCVHEHQGGSLVCVWRGVARCGVMRCACSTQMKRIEFDPCKPSSVRGHVQDDHMLALSFC